MDVEFRSTLFIFLKKKKTRLFHTPLCVYVCVKTMCILYPRAQGSRAFLVIFVPIFTPTVEFFLLPFDNAIFYLHDVRISNVVAKIAAYLLTHILAAV